MRIRCPLCGERDLREFTVQGSAEALDRPDLEAPLEDWHSFLHLRDNPAGRSEELWCHSGGCGAWLIVERDTVTHEIFGTSLVTEASR